MLWTSYSNYTHIRTYTSTQIHPLTLWWYPLAIVSASSYLSRCMMASMPAELLCATNSTWPIGSQLEGLQSNCNYSATHELLYQTKKQWVHTTESLIEPLTLGVRMVWDSLDKVISNSTQCSKCWPSSQILTTLLTHLSVRLSDWVTIGPWYIGRYAISKASFISQLKIQHSTPPHTSASETYVQQKRKASASSTTSERMAVQGGVRTEQTTISSNYFDEWGVSLTDTTTQTSRLGTPGTPYKR